MQKRLIIIFFSFCLMLSLLYMRIAFIMTYPEYIEAGKRQGSYTLKAEPSRGMIYDCNLDRLVSTNEHYLAAIMPCVQNISQITSNVNIKSKQNLGNLIKTGKPFFANIDSNNYDIPFVDIISVKSRSSKNQLAAHIIGYTDSQNKGVTGIEKSYDKYLSEQSISTTISYKLDGIGNPLYGNLPVVTTAPEIKNGIVLTLNKKIQSVCEEIGAKYLKKGAIVVMEPSTGKIKASCSFPNMDVSNLAAQINDNENKPLINRAFLNYNVGSTFKIVTLAQALTQGIDSNFTCYCDGHIDVLGQKFNCHKKTGHGKLNMKTALQMSCNPFYINLSSKLDKKSFLAMASDLSFGKPTIFADSLASSSGYLPTIDELYNPADIANFGFGQGVLMATPIQISQMICTVVNKGNLYTPTLIEGFTNNGVDIINKPQNKPPLNVMSSEVANTIKDYLVSCVMDIADQKAKPTLTTAGGKTATAQTGNFEGNHEIVQAWFTGFYPAQNPKYVITVLAEDGENGNVSASPVFKEIVDKLY